MYGPLTIKRTIYIKLLYLADFKMKIVKIDKVEGVTCKLNTTIKVTV